MTEQKKIPLPENASEGDAQDAPRRSLLERASESFGLGGFKPAAVPGQLVDSKHRKKRGTPPPVEKPQAPAFIERRRSQQVLPAAEPAKTAAEPVEPASPPLSPIHFGGARQSLDRAMLRANGLVVPDAGVTKLLEEFRIVKRQVLQSMRLQQETGKGAVAQRVLVCSPLPGEGKTFTATNLALALAAEKDSEVLLVDADFAKPSILASLGLEGGKGLMDALSDPAVKVEDCVIRTDLAGLNVLPAGSRTGQDAEYLASARTAEVLDRLTQGAPDRLVIFDSPPALAASPAAELARHVGQALLVARADRTGQSALEDAVALLGDCHDIKLLLNAASFSPSGRRFGTYYGYGE